MQYRGAEMKIKKMKFPGALFGTIVVFIIFSIFGDGFLGTVNIINILRNTSILCIVSVGMCLTILSGKIDMSVGAVMSMTGVTIALLLQKGVPIIVSIIITLVFGIGWGAFNGFLIAYRGADFWIVTFGSMSLANGIALILSNGDTLGNLPEVFAYISDVRILGIYGAIWIGIALMILVLFIMKKTKFGYRVYALGDDWNCALLSGVPVKKILFQTYVLSGLFAAIAGILMTSKTHSAMPTAGTGFEFDAIAATLIGGTPFVGGIGGMDGTILGAFLMTMLRNGLSMIGLSALWQYVFIGMIIMLIIIGDVIRVQITVTKNLQRRYRDEGQKELYQ